MASYHGGRGVRGFSWKRLCLCGQLVTRKGLKQALCRIWRYLNFNIFNIRFRLWICAYNDVQYLRILMSAIQYYNKKLNRGQLLWAAACMLINKVSDDACQWNGHEVVISIGGIFFYIDCFVCCMTHEEKLSIQWPCSSNFCRFSRAFCS